MVKLSRMRFARVVAHCCANNMNQGDYEIGRLDELCEFETPVNDLDNLLMLMAESERKLEAIKAYRALTGAEFKESRDAVERYWNDKRDKSVQLLRPCSL